MLYKVVWITCVHVIDIVINIYIYVCIKERGQNCVYNMSFDTTDHQSIGCFHDDQETYT